MKGNLDLALALVEKARHDLETVEIGLAHGVPLDTLAFHCQQAAEKYLKALLAAGQVEYPRTHNLDVLVTLLVDSGVEVEAFRQDLLGFMSYGVAMRYDAALYPDRAEVEGARETVVRLKAFVESRVPGSKAPPDQG